jgi:hypothetical protein
MVEKGMKQNSGEMMEILKRIFLREVEEEADEFF